MKFSTTNSTTFFSRHDTLNIKDLRRKIAVLYSRGGLYMGLISTKINLKHCFLY